MIVDVDVIFALGVLVRFAVVDVVSDFAVDEVFNNLRKGDEDDANFSSEIIEGFGGDGRVGVDDVNGTISNVSSASVSVSDSVSASASKPDPTPLVVLGSVKLEGNGLTSGPGLADVVDVSCSGVVATVNGLTSKPEVVDVVDVVDVDVKRNVDEVVVRRGFVVVVGDADVVIAAVVVVVNRNVGIFEMIIGGTFLQMDDGDELVIGNGVVDLIVDGTVSVVVDLIVDVVDVSIVSSSAEDERHFDVNAAHHPDGFVVVVDGGDVGGVHHPYRAVGRDTNDLSSAGVTVHHPGTAVGAPSPSANDFDGFDGFASLTLPSASRMHASSPL